MNADDPLSGETYYGGHDACYHITSKRIRSTADSPLMCVWQALDPGTTGSTPKTRYTCPECCERQHRSRLRNDADFEYPTLAETQVVLSALCHAE